MAPPVFVQEAYEPVVAGAARTWYEICTKYVQTVTTL